MFLLSVQELDIISDIQSVYVSRFSLSFSLAPQSMSDLCRRIVEVSKPHTVRHTHLVGLLQTSYKPVAEDWTYTTHNNHKTKSHVHSGFQTRDPSNRAATNLRLRPHGHRDRLIKSLIICIKIFYVLGFVWRETTRVTWCHSTKQSKYFDQMIVMNSIP
jgi:hypothetical protein